MELSRQQLTRRICILAAGMILTGVLVLFSATGILGLEKRGSEFYYVLRHLLALGVGAIVMFILARTPYQSLRRFAPIAMVVQILLVCAALYSPWATFAQGASRWLTIGGFTFQPSELAKVSLILYFSAILSSSIPHRPLEKVALSVPILVLLALILIQPDLGTTLLLLGSLGAMLFVAGLRPSTLYALVGAGALFSTLALMGSGYRRKRLLAYLNPWEDPQGSGFQTLQSFVSFHWGGLLGTGPGNGNSKLFFLPEIHTDFIFSLIGEEVGFVGAVAVLVAFAYLVYTLLRASLRAPDRFGQFLGVGLCANLALQVMINVGGVTGLLPVKGLPLPFISWGRTALVVNLISLGILLNITRQSISVKDGRGSTAAPLLPDTK